MTVTTSKMATKNLTHIFTIMRDKAIQRRNVFQQNEDAYSDQDALMMTVNMELGQSNRSFQLPDWCIQVEEIRYTVAALKEKTKKLAAIQTNLIRVPSLDDNTQEERLLADLAADIKTSLERCQGLMVQVKLRNCHGSEAILNRNVVRAIANSLQEVKSEFTQACQTYTTTINNIKKSSSFLLTPGQQEEYGTFDESTPNYDRSKSWIQDQMLFLDDSTVLIEERDRCVQNILKSSLELNQLFKDVAQMVSDQGAVVDQIDYNIEQTSHRVQEGTAQLRKAEKHQRKNRKMTCILGLAAAIIFFIFLLVLVKS